MAQVNDWFVPEERGGFPPAVTGGAIDDWVIPDETPQPPRPRLRPRLAEPVAPRFTPPSPDAFYRVPAPPSLTSVLPPPAARPAPVPVAPGIGGPGADEFGRTTNPMAALPPTGPQPPSVVEAIYDAAVKGFGPERLGLTPGGETEKYLQKIGVLSSPEHGGPIRFLNDSLIRPVAGGWDFLTRTIEAGIAGLGGGAENVALQFGENPSMARRLRHDIEGMAEMGLLLTGTPEGMSGALTRPPRGARPEAQRPPLTAGPEPLPTPPPGVLPAIPEPPPVVASTPPPVMPAAPPPRPMQAPRPVPEPTPVPRSPQASAARETTDWVIPREQGDDMIVMPSGEKIDTAPAVVELDDLIVSHNLEGRPNPNYPAELQPRDRSAPASRTWIDEKSANLEPLRLGRSPTPQEGAPIIGPDRVVESGNGRALLLARAYEKHPNRALEYRAFLERQGFTTQGMKRPVLVRVRKGDAADRVGFSRAANISQTAGYSARERALTDAHALTDDVLGLWRPGEAASASNAPFVRAFSNRAVAPEERPQFMTQHGNLSSEGLKRVEAALVSRGWEAPDVVAALYENPDPGSRAIIGAMADAAPLAARIKAAVAEGRISKTDDPTGAIVEAYRLVDRARQQRQKVGDVIDQMDIERGVVPAEVADAARLFFRDDAYRTAAGRDAVATLIEQRLQFALDRQNAVGDLFTGPQPTRAPAREMAAARDDLSAVVSEAASAKGAGAAATDWIVPAPGPVAARHLGREIVFPDGEHAALFDYGRRIDAGERPKPQEGGRLLETFKGFLEEEPDRGITFRTIDDVNETALDYFERVAEEAAKARNQGKPYRASDTIGNEAALAEWQRRHLGRIDPTDYRGMAEEGQPYRAGAGGAGGRLPPTHSEPPGPPPPPKGGSEKAVLSRINQDGRQPREWNWDKFYTATKDDLHPIEVAVRELTGGRKLRGEFDPYKLARLTRGSPGKAQHFIDYAPFKFHTLEDVGKPLKAILRPVKRDLDAFRAYAVSRRAMELDERGIFTGVPLEAAREVVRKGFAKLEKPFREYVEYHRHLVNYLHDSGIIGLDQLTAMLEANRDYTPFYRVMEESAGRGRPLRRGLAVKQPIEGIRGSGRQIIDPIESTIKNTFTFIALAERNRALNALADLAEKVPGGTEILRPVKRATKEGEIVDEAGEGLASLFKRDALTPGRDQIAIYRQGKRTLYQVNPDIARAVNSLDRDTLTPWIKLLAVPARTLRAGAVLAPDFVIRNFIRDPFVAAVTSKNGFIPFLDSLKGLGTLLKRGDRYREWLKAGGANSALVSMDRRYIDRRILPIQRKSALRRLRQVNPLEAMRIISEAAENATRVGDFKKARKRGKSAFQSAFEAREVTLDFARVGARMQSLNSISAFFNAQLEGVDRIARAFKERPLVTTAKALGWITVPSVILWAANHDDPRIKEAEPWLRDFFWLIPIDDWKDITAEDASKLPDAYKRQVGNQWQHNVGPVLRLPKPFELGVLFGSAFERTLDAFYAEEPRAFDGFLPSLIGVLTPNVIPTAAQPVFEQLSNWHYFFSRPIVPRTLQDVRPEHQYSDYTSETAKLLGEWISNIPSFGETSNASPMVIENYVSAWTGTLGRYAVDLSDATLRLAGVTPEKIEPEDTWADVPFVRGFVTRFPSSNAKSLTRFYDRYTEEVRNRESRTALAKKGDARAKSIPVGPNLEGIAGTLSDLRKLITTINRSPKLSPADKRKLIDRTYLRMIELAKTGNTIFQRFDERNASE